MMFVDGVLKHWHSVDWSAETSRLDIATLELRTVGLAIKRFAPTLKKLGLEAALVVDNTDTENCLAKGQTGSFQLNRQLKFVHHALANVPMLSYVQWICSEDMPADGLTRGETQPNIWTLDHSKLTSTPHRIVYPVFPILPRKAEANK